jgi:serine protease AprX
MACAEDTVPPSPTAPSPPPNASINPADWGLNLVAAEWAKFNATPGTQPGLHVVDPALTAVLRTATAATKLEVIVTFDDRLTTSAAVVRALHLLGVGTVSFKHLPMVFALGTPAQVSGMAALPGVASVYLNKSLKLLLAESTKSLRADATWAAGYTGRGIGVAILDSGVDGLYHPGLKYPSKTIANVKVVGSVKDLVSFDDSDPVKPAAELWVENVPTSETSSGHGTHVAGIAGGNGNGSAAGIYTGVAPGSNLIGIGTGESLVVFWALAGFDYLLENHTKYNIKVVNNSWGTTGNFDPNDPINVATKKVYQAGVTVVFAAGNCGRGDPLGAECPTPGQTQLNPYSVAPWTIGVAAGCKLYVTDPTNSASQCVDPVSGRAPVLANFSSVGVANTIYAPDITAPGVRIVSTRSIFGLTLTPLDALSDAQSCNIAVQHVQYFTCASGTSMAAPHIAGVVALMQESARGTLTPDQVLGVLKKTARPLAGYANWEVGAGYADALAATLKVKK